MNVLLLGSGGREHALAWKLAQSPRLSRLICAPGNPGTAACGLNFPDVHPEDPVQVCRLAREQRVDLVVVGPEAPLVRGVADALRAMGVPVFGPSAGAARLEGSKAFAKEVMRAANVPTARSEIFDSPEQAERRAREWGAVVVKADGLAAGKGVVVARDGEEAAQAVRSLCALGHAGARLVLEEVLEGEEVSVMALCDGERFALLPPAQDHKRVGEGDTGPNTGGMGAYAPTPFLDARSEAEVGERVISPMLVEMRRRGLEFRGALYAGLMMTPQGVQVLEFNCRLGDPETQVLMMQVEEDLLPVFDACARGKLQQSTLKRRSGVAVGVVMAAAGYPATPRTGSVISGLDQAGASAQVFFGGVQQQGSAVVTSGGRVLSVCAHGEDLRQARESAYLAVSRIHFEGSHFRRDIGARALRP